MEIVKGLAANKAALASVFAKNPALIKAVISMTGDIQFPPVARDARLALINLSGDDQLIPHILEHQTLLVPHLFDLIMDSQAEHVDEACMLLGNLSRQSSVCKYLLNPRFPSPSSASSSSISGKKPSSSDNDDEKKASKDSPNSSDDQESPKQEQQESEENNSEKKDGIKSSSLSSSSSKETTEKSSEEKTPVLSSTETTPNDDDAPSPNSTKETDSSQKSKPSVQDKPSRSMLLDLIDVFCLAKTHNPKATFNFLATVLHNCTQIPEARKMIMLRADQGCIFQRLLPFTTFPDSVVRRVGTAGIIRNCCFETSEHAWLLSDDVDILPHLLLPLAGPEELSEDDMDGMHDDLQYLSPDKTREVEPRARRLLLEALTQLCATKSGREHLRERKVYPILR
eukprot:m.171724 g.171724  ORF g.171724 m.171724 type:complete len:398 (+) comp25187_c0_seq3:84-1277(+)